MVIAPPMTDLRYPPIRWQTVFVSTGPLCGQFCAEGRMMRHFRNSLAVTQPISIHRAASFPQHRAIDRAGG
jgi:hypothetical protein